MEAVVKILTAVCILGMIVAVFSYANRLKRKHSGHDEIEKLECPNSGNKPPYGDKCKELEKDAEKWERKEFSFSFTRYVAHVLIYKIVIIALLGFGVRYCAALPLDYDTRMFLCIGLMIAALALTFIFLFQWASASTWKVIAEHGTITCYKKRPSQYAQKYGDGTQVWSIYDNNYIDIVKDIKYTKNWIYIYGSIKKQAEESNHWKTKKYKESSVQTIKIPTYFKDYKELCQMLEDYKR